MLNIRKIALEDFGPFKGLQEINFPVENGVIIVYGENMRGKTTLLNAIRYALFGTVLTRHEQRLSLTNVENWERAAEGKHGFKVILNFLYNGVTYELTRECKLRRGILIPQSDTDYEQVCYLQRNGEAIGPDEAEVEIIRIMPESVSRFFLFDGELLQQYEELLRDESDMGMKIKIAIERILGVPVLTLARANIRIFHDEAQKEEAKASQRNQATQELGNHQARLIEERAAHEEETKRLQRDLQNLKSKKTRLEEDVRKSQRLIYMFNERERLTREIEELNRRQEEKEGKLREQMASAWKKILLPKIQEECKRLQAEIVRYRAKESERSYAEHLLERIEQGLDTNLCPTCEQPLSTDARSIIDALRRKLKETPGTYDRSIIGLLTAKVNVLLDMESSGQKIMVQDLFNDIEDYRVDRHAKNEHVAEINEDTKSIDESVSRRLMSEYDRAVEEISILEKGIRKEQTELEKNQQQIQKIEQRLNVQGGADLIKFRRRRQVASQLHDLMNEAVDVYRDQLRTKVEKDASSLFRNLTTEPDYGGLQINENYGLRIIHADGSIIPVRSAGAEHIVALSLIGALQKNAPLRGPIIMDSPFGRLDDSHTTRVVKTLPEMADQVVLLVYEAEMEPKVARQQLKGLLRREYQIVRRSARYSTIEVRNE